MKKEPTKYPAFVHLNGAVYDLQKAHQEDNELSDFAVKLDDGTVVTVDHVYRWMRRAIEYFESKVPNYEPPRREGFGPGPRDEKGQFRKRYNPNN